VKPAPDLVLQIGATFDGFGGSGLPGFLYCDGNARTAARNAPWGQVAALTPAEQDRMARRESAVYREAAGIFTMSEYLRRSFIQDFGVAEDRVVTVYAGANLDAAKVAERPSVVTGSPTVLFVGKQWEPKGGPEVLAAFAQVRERIPEARLRIVGCSPDVGGAAGVEVLGRISKATPEGEHRLSEVYRSADIFCMPSHFDAFGIVFVEAMLHGIACIGADRCAMPEIIQQGDTGWVTPAGDVAALRDRMLQALSDREALIGMGQRGRERARRLFTWDGVADRMLTAMERLRTRPASKN
jgi:glycosyltransferase involved in cell wall biosynthesis